MLRLKCHWSIWQYTKFMLGPFLPHVNLGIVLTHYQTLPCWHYRTLNCGKILLLKIGLLFSGLLIVGTQKETEPGHPKPETTSDEESNGKAFGIQQGQIAVIMTSSHTWSHCGSAAHNDILEVVILWHVLVLISPYLFCSLQPSSQIWRGEDQNEYLVYIWFMKFNQTSFICSSGWHVNSQFTQWIALCKSEDYITIIIL